MLINQFVISFHADDKTDFFCFLSYGYFLFCVQKLYRSDLDTKDKIIMYIPYFIVIPLMLYFSWNIYSNLSNIDGQFALYKISLSSLFDIVFFNKGLDYQLAAKNYFISSLINRPMSRLFGLTYFELFLIFVIIIISVIVFFLKDNKINISFISITLTIGVLRFAFTMFTLYMFTYSEYEALKLASFERYLQTYIVFIMYVAFFILTFGAYKIKANKGIVLCLIITRVIPISFKENRLFIRFKNEYEGFRTNYEFKELIKQFDSFIDSEDRVLVISQIKDDFIEISSRYEYLDLDIDFISLGEPIEGQEYRNDISYDDWIKLRNEYDYIYKYHTDELFYRKYWLNKEEEYLFNNRLYSVKDNCSLELVS
ncbi:MAG: hypothetical protein ACI4P1_01180 [Erysipelotrichaceae bacterium]